MRQILQIIQSDKKRAAAMILGVLTLLCGCGVGPGAARSAPAPDIVSAIREGQRDLPEMTVILPADAAFFDYLSQRYGINPASVEDGAIALAGGVEAAEITVLRMTGSAEAGSARSALAGYLEQRISAFTGYAPEQAAMAEAGTAVASGTYAALLICPDVPAAETAFLSGVRGTLEAAVPSDAPAAVSTPKASESVQETAQPVPEITEPIPDTAQPVPETPEPLPETTQPVLETPEPVSETAQPVPETPEPVPDPGEDVYDAEAVLAAWRGGDDSALTEKNRAILAKAAEVLKLCVRDDMNAYEKELAVHDWIIEAAEYDPGELSSSPWETPDPDNDNPYGIFYSGKGVCLGYSSTFQLFMDMLGIECITVHGSARDDEPHAWNMVRLDGDWYCVDVTWDDPVSRFPVGPELHHSFFNVVSNHLRATQHHWDEEHTPEAVATAWAWKR